MINMASCWLIGVRCSCGAVVAQLGVALALPVVSAGRQTAGNGIWRDQETEQTWEAQFVPTWLRRSLVNTASLKVHVEVKNP